MGKTTGNKSDMEKIPNAINNMDIEKLQSEQQKESLKLIKNTKGYNWEIRILEINLKRLEEINAEMIERYGEQTP